MFNLSHKNRLSSLVAVSTLLVLLGGGCGAGSVAPTSTSTATNVNACKSITASVIASTITGSTPITTSNGIPVSSPDGYAYSNCNWNLQTAGRTLGVHAETYPDEAGAHDIAVTSLADDRAQSSGFTFTMEPNLGAEAYYRVNATTAQVNFVRGAVFYSLYLSPITGMDSASAKSLLKNLADQVR